MTTLDFPHGTIYCMGRNYSQHAEELNNPIPKSPLIFLKANSTVGPRSGEFELFRGNIEGEIEYPQHELELVVQLNKGGEKLNPQEATDSIGAVTLGMDLTLRRIQAKLKGKGQPWDWAKSFKNSTLLGELLPYDSKQWKLDDLEFNLKLNGELKQSAKVKDMLFSPGQILSHISQQIPLHAGDLLFTGTPHGVSDLKPGDKLNLELMGHSNSQITIEWQAI